MNAIRLENIIHILTDEMQISQLAPTTIQE